MNQLWLTMTISCHPHISAQPLHLNHVIQYATRRTQRFSHCLLIGTTVVAPERYHGMNWRASTGQTDSLQILKNNYQKVPGTCHCQWTIYIPSSKHMLWDPQFHGSGLPHPPWAWPKLLQLGHRHVSFFCSGKNCKLQRLNMHNCRPCMTMYWCVWSAASHGNWDQHR